jgi:hypothetical protein
LSAPPRNTAATQPPVDLQGNLGELCRGARRGAARQEKDRELASDINALIGSAIHALKLKILVFGPQVHTPGADVRTQKLQAKRMEIRDKLEVLGHHVKYAEDLVDPSLGTTAFIQELVLMGEYDLIVTIVDSPGSITEAALIATKPHLAQKASLFLDNAYSTGLVADTCRTAELIGAHFQAYEYPKDLDECNLFGFIQSRVVKFQTIKYLL